MTTPRRIVFASLALTLALTLSSCEPNNPYVGKPAPEFLISPLQPTGDVALSSFRGKVVLIDFWATWCGPCKSLMPHIEKLNRKYAAKGLVVLGISEEPISVVDQFKHEHPEITYDLFSDSRSQATSRFGVTQLPTTAVIDRKGNVVFYDATGYSDASAEDLEQRVADTVG